MIIVSNTTIHPHLEQLRSQGFSISDSVVDSILMESGE
jgi:predicted nucleic acid-binding protein